MGPRKGKMSKTYARLNGAIEKLQPNESIYCNMRPNGKRYFVASTENAYWEKYMTNPRNEIKRVANCEVILESRPCHLYVDLDLEKSKCKNSVEELWDELSEPILQLLNNHVSSAAEIDIRKHDSSSDKKGSLHVIVQVENYLFHNNFTVGIFMNMVRQLVEEEGSEFLKYAFAEKFIDMSVYSKNRQFRMLHCFKWSKKDGAQNFTRQLTDVSVQKKYMDKSFDSWRFNKVQPIDSSTHKIIDLRSAEGLFQSAFDSMSSCGALNISSPTSAQKDLFFYELLVFVEKKYSPIRNYKFFPTTLSLSITLQSKKCFFKKNHEHRSNDTRIIVSLMHGTWYEACWSEGCRSQPRKSNKLPEELIVELDRVLQSKITFKMN